MRNLFLLLALVVVTWPAQAQEGDSYRQELLAQVDELEDQERWDDVIAALDPVAVDGDAEILGRLAAAHMMRLAALPADAAAARAADAVVQAERASEAGVPAAWNYLWIIYATGMGVAIDLPRASSALRNGAKAGDPGATLNLAIAFYEGSEFFPRDRNEACVHFAAVPENESTLPVLEYFRGLIQLRGECGVESDEDEALATLERSASAGHGPAARLLAIALTEGWAGSPDPEAALDWWERAAETGDPEARWRLGVAYSEGRLRPHDPKRAIELFKLAIADEFPSAFTSLGVMYASGEGVQQDFVHARTLYEQALQLGEHHVHRNLSAMYALGEGMPVDRLQARLHYLIFRHYGNGDVRWLRDLIESEMDENERALSQQRFEAWLEQQPREQRD